MSCDNYEIIGHVTEFCDTCPKETFLGKSSPSSPVISKQIRQYPDGTQTKVCHVCEFSIEKHMHNVSRPPSSTFKQRLFRIMYSPLWYRLGSQF